MKKVILILVLLLSTLQPVNTSAASASHEQLSEYSGYAEALYESVLREKAYLAGQYSNNKEYVEQTVDELISSGKSFFNEMISIEGPTDIIEKIYAGGITAGEWVKRLFERFNQKEQEKVDFENSAINFGAPLEKYFRMAVNGNVSPKSEYIVTYGTKTLSSSYNYAWGYEKNVTVNLHLCPSGSKRISRIYFTADTSMARVWCGNDSVKGVPLMDSLNSQIVNGGNKLRDTLHAIVTGTNGSFTITHKATNQRVDVDFPPIKENPFTGIKDYIDNDTVPSKIKPLSATLICPDGNRISIKYDGATFLDKNGKVVQVAKDGTAVIESGVCHTEWNQPTISYDSTGKVTIEQDGVTTDLETGEDIDFDDEIEDGCGVVCAIGKMLTGLGQIAKSIAGLATKILDGLLGLFVPDDLDFVSEEFDKMSAKFTDKFSLLTGLKDTITGVFKSGDSSNPLADINMSLPAAPGSNFSLDTVSFIEPFVPRIKQIISAILFLMTIIYVYRKITGRGGVMEK